MATFTWSSTEGALNGCVMPLRIPHVFRRCPQQPNHGDEVALETFALEAADERRDQHVTVALFAEGAVAGEPHARQNLKAR